MFLRQWRRSGKRKDRMKLRWFLEFHPPLNASVLFYRVFKNLTMCMTKLKVLVLDFSYFTDNSNRFIHKIILSLDPSLTL